MSSQPPSTSSSNAKGKKGRPNRKGLTTSQNSETTSSSVSSEGEEQMCLICCEGIKVFALGQCNHRDVCSMCTLRRRELYKETDCCICKSPLPNVIFTKNETTPFESFNLKSLIFDADLSTYFEDKEYHEEVVKMWDYQCTTCSHPPFNTFSELDKHMKKDHKLFFCKICVADRMVFMSEQQVYTQGDLLRHMVEWDGGVGGDTKEGSWKGHPMCEFCALHFYGMDHLYKHLQDKHFTCHVCEKAGVMYQYYKDYNDLEKHFGTDHYPCTHPDCLAQKYVVFGSPIDLKAHQLSHQKKSSRSDRQIDIQFNYLRSRGRSGEGQDDALERPYRHRTRRRDAGYDSDPDDNAPPSSSSSSAPSSSDPPTIQRRRGRQNDTGNRRATRAPQAFAPGFRNRENNQQAQAGEREREREREREQATKDTQEQEAKEKEVKERETKETKEREAKEREAKEQAKEEDKKKQELLEKEQEKEREKQRNKQLIKDLKDLVGEEAYTHLREASGEYRSGAATAREYYDILFSSLRTSPRLLLQLIALLPDQEKRLPLERIHAEYTLWESAYPSLQSEPPSQSKGQKEKETEKMKEKEKEKMKGKGKGKGKEPAAPVKTTTSKAPKGWDMPKKTNQLFMFSVWR